MRPWAMATRASGTRRCTRPAISGRFSTRLEMKKVCPPRLISYLMASRMSSSLKSESSVSMGWRLGGGVWMTLRSRAPMSENCRVRGMGVAVRVRQSTLAFICLSFSLALTPNFCSSSMMRSPRSLNFRLLVGDGVGADEDVYLALFDVLVYLVLLLGGAEAVEVVDAHGHAFEALAEGVVVLEGEDGVGHEDGHLLGVAAGLEGGADGHLGLAEAHVAADQAVHGGAVLHVVLDGEGGFELVGGVLVLEGGLHLLLQGVVGAEGEALRGFALGVEGDEVLGDVLHLPLGLGFEHLPGVAAEAVELRRLALAAHIARDLVQAVDGDVEDVVVLVYQADELLALAVVGHLLETREAADAVVDMGDEVAGLELEELLEGQRLVGGAEALDGVFVVAVEDFVVGVAEDVLVVVDEAVA